MHSCCTYSAVYGNSSASGLFISAVQSRYKMNASPSKLSNVVTCLRNMHKDQSGSVVVLLVEKMLSAGHCGISRLVDSVACRRVEVLLAEDSEVRVRCLNRDIFYVESLPRSTKYKHCGLLYLHYGAVPIGQYGHCYIAILSLLHLFGIFLTNLKVKIVCL